MAGSIKETRYKGAPIWAIDEQATTRAIDEYFRLGYADVADCSRRRQIDRWKEIEIAKWRGAQAVPAGTIRGYINSEGAQADSEAHRRALCQRMKEEAIEANWEAIQAARRAPSTETGASIDSQKIDPNITINGKNYTRLLDQARAIVRARIEIVAAIGK